MKFQQRSGEGYQTEKKGRDKEGKMKIVGKYRLFKKSDFINMYVWQRLKGQQDQSKAWIVDLFIYFLLGGKNGKLNMKTKEKKFFGGKKNVYLLERRTSVRLMALGSFKRENSYL